MNTTATLKKWVVENKLDKDGLPDPRVVMTLEIPFREHLAKRLAEMTTGDCLRFVLEKIQIDMDMDPPLRTDGFEVVNGTEDAAQTEELEGNEQPLLLTEGAE